MHSVLLEQKSQSTQTIFKFRLLVSKKPVIHLYRLDLVAAIINHYFQYARILYFLNINWKLRNLQNYPKSGLTNSHKVRLSNHNFLAIHSCTVYCSLYHFILALN